MWQFEQAAVVAAVVLFVLVLTLGLFVDQHLLEPLPVALVSWRVATQAGGYQVVEAAVGSTMVVESADLHR